MREKIFLKSNPNGKISYLLSLLLKKYSYIMIPSKPQSIQCIPSPARLSHPIKKTESHPYQKKKLNLKKHSSENLRMEIHLPRPLTLQNTHLRLSRRILDIKTHTRRSTNSDPNALTLTSRQISNERFEIWTPTQWSLCFRREGGLRRNDVCEVIIIIIIVFVVVVVIVIVIVVVCSPCAVRFAVGGGAVCASSALCASASVCGTGCVGSPHGVASHGVASDEVDAFLVVCSFFDGHLAILVLVYWRGTSVGPYFLEIRGPVVELACGGCGHGVGGDDYSLGWLDGGYVD